MTVHFKFGRREDMFQRNRSKEKYYSQKFPCDLNNGKEKKKDIYGHLTVLLYIHCIISVSML